jgi:cation diffusion facilitator CzcD-associated flavoprotein CzcO
VAREFGIEPLIRFDTEVASAEFDDTAGTWKVTTAKGDSVKADVLILATGQLSRPKMPAVAAHDNSNANP